MIASDPPARHLFLHIDMDAFFAAVEERDNPQLGGRPIAVGGGGARGVVTAANYVARRYGLCAGMPAGQAHRRCPHAVFLPVNGRKYTYISARIMSELAAFSPDVRPLSVDEASLNISHWRLRFDSPMELGAAVKRMIHSVFNLPCTVGIGPNRLVAKMAAELAKPDGLKQILPGEAAAIFAPLPVDKMIGIGQATRRALEGIGIRTLGDLQTASDMTLRHRFGIYGPTLKMMAHGEYAGRMSRDDAREYEEKSIGHQRTFERNISDRGELRGKLVGLAEMVARRVRGAGLVGGVLSLTVRYGDFHTFTHQSRLQAPTGDEGELIHHAWRLLDEAWEAGREVRLLGLSLGDLTARETLSRQLDMFTFHRQMARERLDRALDALRDRFGEKVVARAMGGRWMQRRTTLREPSVFSMRSGE